MVDFEKARQAMIDGQVRVNDVNNEALLKALKKTPREIFAPKSQSASVYSDHHTELSEDRWLINIRDFSKLVQCLAIQPDEVGLDIACGRGYSTAILSYLAEMIVGLEDDQKWVDTASKNLQKLEINNAVILKGSLEKGIKKHGPYDIIFINAAVSFIPKAWFDQLSESGRLGVFLKEKNLVEARIYKKIDGHMSCTVLFETNIPVLAGFEKKEPFLF